jgi:hypothetical protein
MKNKRQSGGRRGSDTEFGADDDYTSLDVASYTEMTGAVPRPPITDAEAEGYSDIVSMPQKRADHAGKQKLRKNRRNEFL